VVAKMKAKKEDASGHCSGRPYYKGLSRDSFQEVARALNPVYISLREYKDGKQINLFTGRR